MCLCNKGQICLEHNEPEREIIIENKIREIESKAWTFYVNQRKATKDIWIRE